MHTAVCICVFYLHIAVCILLFYLRTALYPVVLFAYSCVSCCFICIQLCVSCVVLCHEQRKVSDVSYEKQHIACIVLIASNSVRLTFYLIPSSRITRSESFIQVKFDIITS